MLTLRGPHIYTDDGIVREISLREGKIATLNADALAGDVLEFPASYTVVPGFIDLHVHGIEGVDVMDASHESLQQLRNSLLRNGTTAFLATTMSADANAITAVLNVLHQQKNQNDGAEVLGVHLEGPFIAKEKAGAQDAKNICPPNLELIQLWQEKFPELIKIVTLAPELPDALALMKYLKQQKIIVAAGHSNANYAQGQEAIASGCTYATHLFNAMRAIHHREPGLAVAALLDSKVMVELIADGVHLHPAMIALAIKLKSIHNVVLVTDAMRGACMQDGCYDLGGQEILVTAEKATLSDGTLAGSTLTMPKVFKNILRFTDCTIQDAITMCSVNPAKLMGVYHRKGSLAIGKDADLVVLDENYNLVTVFSAAKRVLTPPMQECRLG